MNPDNDEAEEKKMLGRGESAPPRVPRPGVGRPSIVYARMQATGMVNDHLTGCFRYLQA
jgi:hypothetical protein